MRAWILPGYTGVQSMNLGEFPEPVAGPGEIVLAVRFAALNPADAYLSIGQYPAKPTFPHVLGRDGIGTVVALGENVTGIRVGDTRLILRGPVGVDRPGTLAQRVAVPADYTVEPPHEWSLEEAAAAPLVYATAWQALTQWGELPPGSTILVTGASGGVGVAAIQLGRAMKHRVIALSRGTQKAARLREVGAVAVLDATSDTWRDELKQQFPQRVDLAIDNIGGEGFNQVLDVMGMHGRISVVGRLAGPVPSFNTASLFFRRLKVGGVAVGAYSNAEIHVAWRGVLATLVKTGAKPLIDHVFSFEEVPAAFARLKEGPMGKVLVRVDG